MVVNFGREVFSLVIAMGILWGSGGADIGAPSEEGGMVTGLVLVDGEPTEGVVVTVREVPNLGTLSRNDGRFVLEGVPPGKWVFQAQLIGYDRDVAFVSVERGDSVHVRMELSPTQIPFGGVDYPLASTATLEAAELLLPRAMEELVASSWWKERWPEVSLSDTLDVLGMWAQGLEQIVPTKDGPVLRLVGECERCVEQRQRTLEAGLGYVAGVRHVRVGVRGVPVGAPRVGFCLGLAEPGDFLLDNCVGPPGASANLWFWKSPAGQWVRLSCAGVREIDC